MNNKILPAYREPVNQKTNKDSIGKEINDIIRLFKPLNSSYQTFFSNFAQRAFCKKLLRDHSKKEITEILQHYRNIKPGQFRSPIYSPADLFTKWSQLGKDIVRNKQKFHGESDNSSTEKVTIAPSTNH
jgi:hypothetical protein